MILLGFVKDPEAKGAVGADVLCGSLLAVKLCDEGGLAGAGADTVDHPPRAGVGGAGGSDGGGGAGAEAVGGATVLPVSRDVQPPVRNAGAEFDDVEGGFGGGDGCAALTQPLRDCCAISPLAAAVVELDAAGEEDSSVAQPPFLNPEDLSSRSSRLSKGVGSTDAEVDAAVGSFGILIPAALASFRSSFSSRSIFCWCRRILQSVDINFIIKIDLLILLFIY